MRVAVTMNFEQQLYVLTHPDGLTTFGFEVCRQRTRAIALELNRVDLAPTAYACQRAYRQYEAAVAAPREHFRLTGRALQCELTPQLLGLEGRRVEVVDCSGERRRFQVGKSTGWIPVHLALRSRASCAGFSVMDAPFRSVRVLS